MCLCGLSAGQTILLFLHYFSLNFKTFLLPFLHEKYLQSKQNVYKQVQVIIQVTQKLKSIPEQLRRKIEIKDREKIKIPNLISNSNVHKSDLVGNFQAIISQISQTRGY
jgi:hypothetical protein